MKKVEVTTLERKIYENYLLKIKKEHLKWNQTQLPNIMKKMSKDIIGEVSAHIKNKMSSSKYDKLNRCDKNCTTGICDTIIKDIIELLKK